MKRGSETPAAVIRHVASLSLVATALALASLQLAVFVSSAQAAVEATRTYAPGPFYGSQGSEPGQFSAPRQIAVEKGSGNLLVTDTGNGRIQVFSTDAKANPSYLTTLGAGTVQSPVGIAVDPGDGAIYVSDSGLGEVLRFTSDGATPPTYTLDGSFTSPTLSSYGSQLAVDPSTHDLLVADRGAQLVRRIDVTDGSELDFFNGDTSTGGPFTSLRGIAVGPTGRIYVADDLYANAVYFEGSGRIEQFNSDGEPLGQLTGTSAPGAVWADPVSGEAFVGWANQLYSPPRRLAVYQTADTPMANFEFPGAGESGAASIATSDAQARGVFILTEPAGGFAGSPGIQPFKPAEIPGAEIEGVSSVTATTAHLSGAVNPGSLSGPATAHFEYSTDGLQWISTADIGGIVGPGTTEVSADLSALRPITKYLLRLAASNEDLSKASTASTFETAGAPPEVELRPAGDRTSSSLTLRGAVNPLGEQTTYHFEYGLTDSYGSSAPAGAEVAGNGYKSRSASVSLTGLTPSTTYHYRLVARNATGTTSTDDATFTMRDAGEPTRVYEQVTPVNKGGAVINTVAYHEAKADGDAFLFQTRNAMDLPNTAGAPLESRYAARRSPSGWDLRTLDAPQSPIRVPELLSASTVAISDDFSHALVVSAQDLAPGGEDDVGNYYRRDVETGELELVATGLNYFSISGATGSSRFYAASPDFSTIFFDSDAQLTDDAPFGVTKLYEWREGHGLRLASRMPNGGPSDGIASIFIDRLESPTELDLATADGSQVYFATWGGSADGIYRVSEGVTTRVLTTPEAASVLDVSADGRYVAYRMGFNLYRYDTSDGSSELTLENFGNEYQAGGYLGMSDDGSSFALGRTGSTEIQVWRDGVLTPIAKTSLGDDTGYNRNLFFSPNGRYFVFSTSALEGQSYDNIGCAFDALDSYAVGGHCVEIYIYDAVENELSCVSCPADGSRSTGHAHNSFTQVELGGYAGRRVSNSGEVLFDTPTKLAAADTNGVRDVYLYQDGEARLISPGNGPHDAYLADASASFDDIFFVTDQSLVGQDSDSDYDVYDARVGGGIASQSAGGGGVRPCSGSDCRAPVPPANVTAPIGSESVVASPRQKPRPHHHKRKRRKARKNRAKHAGSGKGRKAPRNSNRVAAGAGHGE